MTKKRSEYQIPRYYITTEEATKIFETYCEDVALGIAEKPYRYVKDGDDVIKVEVPIDITPENFVMIHADLPEENLWSTARKQIPRQYFISPETGIVLTFEGEEPRWYVGNQRAQIESDPFDGQLKFTPYDSVTKDIKVKPITMRIYVLLAIIGASIGQTHVFVGYKMEEHLRKYGVLCFGVGNSGNANNTTQKGARGLIITKKVKKGEMEPEPEEIIEPDEMLDVHHTNGRGFYDYSHLEILPHWLHDYLKIYTATISTKEELYNLLTRDPECRKRLDELASGRGYTILDNSNAFDANGNSKIYIHYSGINTPKPLMQVKNQNYKHFLIVWITLDWLFENMTKRDLVILDNMLKTVNDYEVIKVHKNTRYYYTNKTSQPFWIEGKIPDNGKSVDGHIGITNASKPFWVQYKSGSIKRYIQCKLMIDKNEKNRHNALIDIADQHGGYYEYHTKASKLGECVMIICTDPNRQLLKGDFISEEEELLQT